MNTAPADADPAVIIATNMLAIAKLGGIGPLTAPTVGELETLCRWIADHQHCEKPYGEPVGFDEPAPRPRRRFRLTRRRAA